MAAAIASLILLPISQAFSDERGETLGQKRMGGIEMAQRGEEAPGMVPTYSRANYQWPYAEGPYYGDESKGLGQDAKLLRTSVGVFDLSKGQPRFPQELKAQNKLDKGPQYFIVQLDPGSRKNGSLGELKREIAGVNGKIVRTLQPSAMIVLLDKAGKAKVDTNPDVIAVEPYHAAFKLDPTIGRVPLPDPMKAVSEVYDLEIRVFPGEDSNVVAHEIKKLGGSVSAVYGDTVRAEIHRSKLGDVAAIEPVEVVFEAVPANLWGEETTTTVQTGRYNAGATPYHDAGIDGGGGGLATAQILMILDSGIQIDAGDLSETRVSAGAAGVGHRKVRFYGTTDPFAGLGDLNGCDAGPSGGYSHGHVVAATALGNATRVSVAYGAGWQLEDNNGNLWKVDGVAKGAKLVAYDAQQTPAATSCADPLQATVQPGDLYQSGAAGPCPGLTCPGSLGVGYTTHGARVFNFSWGSPSNVYSGNSQDIDQFLLEKGDALVFVAAGNAGLDSDNDGVPDSGSLGTPATTKNGLAIGASRAANDQAGGGAEDEREFFSSIGPAPGGRIAPQLMSPGGEENNAANMGLRTEYACRTNDNDQADPVECDRVDQLEGTSFASPGAAGAALLVRDYFAQGGYPDGTTTDAGNVGDQIANVSGALVKAVLIASADFMTGDLPPSFSGQFPGGDGLTVRQRFNNEQGYGRIQLSNALPLQTWPSSVSGLRIQDSVVNPVAGGIGLANTVDADSGGLTSTTFNVCNPQDELRIALAWFDDAGQALVNDLDLEVQSPSGKIYRGNYFTDDDNRNGALDANEDCPSIDGSTGTISAGQWSLPACTRADLTPSPFDRANPTEAIFLSPDPLDSGVSPSPNSQIEVGNWTIRVSSPGNGSNPTQTYAVVIAGGVCSQSWARLDQAEYTCNQTSTPTIFEFSEGGDVAPTAAQVTSRTVMQVINSAGTVLDSESGLAFVQTPGTLVFTGPHLVLTSVTERDPGNGALDARDGDFIRVTYTDTTGVRQSVSAVNCKPRLGFGNIVFAQYGMDTTYFVGGGCERNARGNSACTSAGVPSACCTGNGTGNCGNFEFGFPDRYMDAGEQMTYNFAFASNEPEDLNNVKVDLRCVIADGDSPKDCRPNSTDCTDPNRANNLTCDGKAGFAGIGTKYMSIIDTPKTIGLITGNSGLSANFSIVMEPAIAGTPEIDMVLLLSAANSGKSANSMAISRHTLDVDEQSLFYSTDFPTGALNVPFDISQNREGDEILQNPVTNVGDFLQDYRFETLTWSDLTAGGTKNTALQAPWHFDTNDGGFQSGLLATSSESTITNTISQWGEDKNFNGVDDKRCSGDIRVACNRAADCTGIGSCLSVEDRDPALGGPLDRSWNIRGGCGWQTKSPNTCSNDVTKGCFSNADCTGGALCNGASPTGGIWHTGRIGGTTGNCLVTGNDPGQCQAYETVGGTQGIRSWREHIITPVIQKVNGANYTPEIVQWRWNQAVELADNNAAWAWEFDTDVLALKPADLFSDNTVLNALFGPFGAVGKTNNPRLTNGYSMFAPMTANMQQSFNGVVGNNRQGKNACFFEGGAIISGAGGPCPGCPFVPGELGFAGPLDNDIDDDGDAAIDEFVTTNGPVRNMDIFAVNGPDMRFSTLEDIYGETKEFFQGSIGFWTFEKTPTEADPQISYGLGVDDVVVEWREFNLVKDTTNCATGECAVLDVLSNNTFEGSTSITITALEKTPDAANDCNLDNVPDGTIDCNGNGKRDLVVRATSNTEFAGEIVFLDATATPNQYVGEIPVSSRYDTTPGVLFVSQQGTDNPVVTVTYRDNNDGTGVPCKNDVNPAEQGRIIANTTVVLGLGNIQVIATLLTDNGDNDGFADTNETVNMRLRIVNKTDENLTNLAARLSTNDPKIDCILDSFIFVGNLGGGAETVTTDSFAFRVANVDRTTLGLNDLQNLSAALSMGFASDQFDGLASPQSVTIDLDLDASGGSGATTYFEGFESGTLGTFQAHNIDQPLNNLVASDGYRCQYSDPDWPNANSYGQITDCFLAANQAHADAFFWQVWPSTRFGGRSFSGNNSLYMGIWGATSDFLTTPVSIMEAVRMTNPINLGVVGVPPELTYKQQVDLLDSRSVNSPPGDAPGRYVTMLQLADGAGNPVGSWIKLVPYLNTYDQQGVDNYFNCMFDPIDDGNDEDDFFDPTDPDRRLGPSSMCKPEFSFSYLGETFLPFAENRLGLAEGPGLQGNLGLGTWVESKFNLERFRGRRARLRFINSDLKINGTNTTWASLFTTLNPGPGDDGIVIDDIQVTNTLTSPATISVDNKANAGLPACGATCTAITPALGATPPGALTAPGQVVELSSLASTADRCLDGVLQYRFWIDGNNNGQGGNPLDTLLRNWTDNPNIVDAPTATTRYVVDVRCSTLTSCTSSTSRTVVVTCPTSGAQGQGFPKVTATTKTSIAWTGSINYNFAKGALANFALGSCTTGAPATCYTTTASAQNQGPANTFSTAADSPAANTGLWYLFRRPGTKGTGGSGFCNSPPITWGAPGTEPATRDAVLP